MEEVRAEMFRIRLWLLILALTAALLPSLSIASTENPEISPAMVRLPGHVLPALARATVVPSNPSSGSESITLTIVLRRDDQAGFESYLHDIYDSHSKNFREFLTQRQIADRFGPRRDDYDAVISYIRAKGFRILQGSRNRLTVTVRGTRAQAESAFDLRIHSYRIGARTFYANDRDPAVPVELAPLLQAVAGLSNLARPEHGKEFLILIVLLAGVCAVVFTALGFFVPGILICFGAGALLSAYAACALGYFGTAAANICNLSSSSTVRRPDIAVNGTGQTIGLIEFDTFQSSDVADYLNLIGSPTLISNLSNDYVGFRRGHDTPDSPRMRYTVHPLASGVLEKRTLLSGLAILVLIGVAITIYFVIARGWLAVGFAAAGLSLLFLYDAAPTPLKSIGLGEFAVLLVWGPLMIGGGFAMITGQLSSDVIFASVPYGLGVMTILNGKHIDQIDFDSRRHIRTLPVLIGESAARVLTMIALIAIYAVVAALIAFGRLTPFAAVIVIALPKAVRAIRIMSRERPDVAPTGYVGWPLWYHRACLEHNRLFGWTYIAGLAAAAIWHAAGH